MCLMYTLDTKFKKYYEKFNIIFYILVYYIFENLIFKTTAECRLIKDTMHDMMIYEFNVTI